MLGDSLSQTCSQSPFPKVFGGSSGPTVAHQLDYHSSTDQMSVGGQISDQVVKATTVANLGNPYLALYVGPYYIYSWAKWLNILGSV